MLTLVNITVFRPDAKGLTGLGNTGQLNHCWICHPQIHWSSFPLHFLPLLITSVFSFSCLFLSFFSLSFSSFPFFCLFSVPLPFLIFCPVRVSSFAIFVVLAAAAFFSVFFGLIDKLFFCFKRLSLLSARVIHCYQQNQLQFTVVVLFLDKNLVLSNKYFITTL